MCQITPAWLLCQLYDLWVCEIISWRALSSEKLKISFLIKVEKSLFQRKSDKNRPKHSLAHATRRPKLRLLRKHVRYTRFIVHFNACVHNLPCHQSVEIIEGYRHEGTLTRTPLTYDETKSSPCYKTTKAPIAAQTRSLYALHYTLQYLYPYTLPCLPIRWDN